MQSYTFFVFVYLDFVNNLFVTNEFQTSDFRISNDYCVFFNILTKFNVYYGLKRKDLVHKHSKSKIGDKRYLAE